MRVPQAMPAIPPRKVATVAGRRIEYVLAGTGTPPVVLVNGSGGPLTGWSRILGPLAEATTVLAYNRPGVGASSRPTHPQTGSAVAADLRLLLDAAGVSGPYVLVGHSLGGLFGNLVARLHPADVAAAVFVEAAHPGDRRLVERQPSWLRLVNAAIGRAHLPSRTPDLGETAHVDETVREVERAGPFPAIPVAVVTGGRRPPRWLMPDAAVAVRLSGQRMLASLSPTSRAWTAERSGHFPQLTEPDVVIDAILWAWTQARTAITATR